MAELEQADARLAERHFIEARDQAEALLGERPRNFRARRILAEAAAALGDADRVLGLMAEAEGLFEEERLQIVRSRVIASCRQEEQHRTALDIIAGLKPGAWSKYPLLVGMVEWGARKRNLAAFLAVADGLEDTVEGRALHALVALAKNDLAGGVRGLATIPEQHPARYRVLRTAFACANLLHDDGAKHRLGMELLRRHREPGRIMTVVATLKAAATLCRIEDARQAYEAAQALIREIRGDPEIFARHWRNLITAAVELLDLDGAETDMNRAVEEGLITRDDADGIGGSLQFMRQNRAELDWSAAAVEALLNERAFAFPEDERLRILVPRLELFNVKQKQNLSLDESWRAVLSEAIRQARLFHGVACLIPEWLAVQAARLKTPPRILSYHTHGDQPGVMHFKEADLPGFVCIDRSGYAGWSSIATKRLEELPLDQYTPEFIEDFVGSFRRNTIENNISKYRQPARSANSTDLPEFYVFVALQVRTDRVQALARIPMLEMLDIVVRRFSGTDIQVVVKRHPYCRDIDVSDRLEELEARGAIILRNDSIHDLIENARAVITVNSGVGSEALFYMKPVYCFGLSDYSSAVHNIYSEEDFFLKSKNICPAKSRGQIYRFICFYRNEFLVLAQEKNKLTKIFAEFLRNPSSSAD